MIIIWLTLEVPRGPTQEWATNWHGNGGEVSKEWKNDNLIKEPDENRKDTIKRLGEWCFKDLLKFELENFCCLSLQIFLCSDLGDIMPQTG